MKMTSRVGKHESSYTKNTSNNGGTLCDNEMFEAGNATLVYFDLQAYEGNNEERLTFV